MSTSQPMDEGQIYPSSSQSLSLKQQVIALSQTYPCPRCSNGTLEPYGHTETMLCTCCKRGFVPLRGGRLLFPSNSLGWKIAPTFWWDGYKWHWGGTTSTAKQLSLIVLLSFLPVIAIASSQSYLSGILPSSIPPLLLCPIVGLLSMQIIYALCWDFEFKTQKEEKTDSLKEAKQQNN